MKKITTVIKMAFISFAMAAGTVVAQPVVYTVPSTTLGGGTISGTVTYDATTDRFTAINLTSTGTHAGAYTFLSESFNGVGQYGQKTASLNADDIIIFPTNTFPSIPGTSSDVNFEFHHCTEIVNGLCNGFSLAAVDPFLRVRVTFPGAASSIPTPIPTLGQWGMIFLASLMAMFAMRRVRRQP